MTSCSSTSGSDDEANKHTNELSGQVGTISLASLNAEQALKYLNDKYPDRFTEKDPSFAKALEQPPIPPPIVLNYTGKKTLLARRNNFFSRRNDHDRSEQRYHSNNSGSGEKRRYEHDNRRSDRYDGR